MREEIGTSNIVRRPAQAVGEIRGEARHVGRDQGEGPVCDGDRCRGLFGRQLREDDVDAGRLVFAMPFCGEASGEAETARAILSGNDPHDVAGRPAAACLQKAFCSRQRCGDVRREDGVVRFRCDLGVFPAVGQDHRWVEVGETCAHRRRRLDARPEAIPFAHRCAELSASGADIEQIADCQRG